MVAVSGELIWQLTRNNSCFLRKQKNLPVMSAEKDNLAGLNAFKYPALANKFNVGIRAQQSGQKELAVLATGTKKNGHKTHTAGVKKNKKKTFFLKQK